MGCLHATLQCTAQASAAEMRRTPFGATFEWTSRRRRDVAHAILHVWTSQAGAAEMRRMVFFECTGQTSAKQYVKKSSGSCCWGGCVSGSCSQSTDWCAVSQSNYEGGRVRWRVVHLR